jgi:hypothetical protein
LRKEKLLRRLRNLYSLEFVNAFFVPFVFLMYCHVHNEPVGLNSIIAFILNGILLLEGSYLWFQFSRQLTTPRPHSLKEIFKKLKKINLTLILLAITFIAVNPSKGVWDRYGTIYFSVVCRIRAYKLFRVSINV